MIHGNSGGARRRKPAKCAGQSPRDFTEILPRDGQTPARFVENPVSIAFASFSRTPAERDGPNRLLAAPCG
jgi:hypothetical protein